MRHAKLPPKVDEATGLVACGTCHWVYSQQWAPPWDEYPGHFFAGACPKCPELDIELEEAIKIEQQLRQAAMEEKGLPVEETLTVEQFKALFLRRVHEDSRSTS